MNKPEKLLWQRVKTCMGTIWDCQRHEEKYSVGIPDVSFAMKGINGWLELKYLKEWPKSGPVLIPHFTPQQKNWLYKRNEHGGNCFLLLQIGDHYVAINGDKVLDVGSLDKEQLLSISIMDIYDPTNDKLRLALYRCIITLYY